MKEAGDLVMGLATTSIEATSDSFWNIPIPTIPGKLLSISCATIGASGTDSKS